MAMELDDLARRVQLGIERGQVAFGKDRLVNLSRRHELGLIWATEDLSSHTLGKLRIEAAKYKVPVLIAGDADEVGLITHQPTVRIYLIRKGFAGLNFVLHELREQGKLE